ncbi:MAG: protoglobin domain-containing protein [bacterium]|nr:protoglobin domain-containing protein [bacterium]
MEILKLDEQELKSRLTFFELTDEDFRRLASLQDFAKTHADELIEALYELILGHPATRTFFPDEKTIRHAQEMQKVNFARLFSGKYDLAYVENRLIVGQIHEQIGMPPKWYLGAYRRYLNLIRERLDKHFKDKSEEAAKAFSSVQKIIFFDIALAMDAYIAANLETTTRHQAAIRELSTPVIKVHSRVLLMPIVGTVDTLRAQQIMETVLIRVVQDQAKVIIIDIAGVPVVDTKVADHLLRTTASVKLLGAQTILTGISATVAKTVVQLGVDISSMYTSTSLAEGIEFALEIVGKEIVSKTSSSHNEKGRG